MKQTSSRKKNWLRAEQDFLIVGTAANRHCVTRLSSSGTKVLPRKLVQLVHPYFNGSSKAFARFQKRLIQLIHRKKAMENLKFEFQVAKGNHRILLLNARSFFQSTDALPLILLRLEDITRLHKAEVAREQRMRELGKRTHVLENRVDARTAELQEANRKLHLLSARLLEAQEMERRHLARELHDEIGQQITCLQILAESQITIAPPELKRACKETSRAAGELLQTVRRLSADLRPQLLDDFGLMAALEWHFARFHKRTGIEVKLNRKNFHDELLNSFLRNVLFRVAQEALTNVARHAGVNRVTVDLSTQKGFCRLRISDKGKGFQLQAALQKKSFGLSGMQERAFLAGGNLEFDSRLGKGTTIALELPLISFQTDAFEPS